MGKLAYFFRSLTAQFDTGRFSCPNCGSPRSDLVERKYIITQLRRCRSCELLFRTPADDAKNNERFYDDYYSQGFTTDLPTDIELEKLKRSNFAGSQKDYSYYINVLFQIGIKPGDRIFDFGCSWGYGSYQLVRAGYDVVAYEVASKRKRYAETKLGVKFVTNIEQAAANPSHKESYDCFFAAHVIEHVPAPSKAFGYAFKLLREGGLFVSFTPNGSSACRATHADWSRLWGEVHPNFIDDRFLARSFANSPRTIGTTPIRDARPLEEGGIPRVIDDLTGGELFFVARKTPRGW